MAKGKHFMGEGSDGSGKDTIIGNILEFAKQKNLKIFDVIEYSKKTCRLPFYEDFKDYDIIYTAEPTYSWVGKGIREEIIRKNKNYFYSARLTAQAYALDRAIHYNTVLIPARESGKIIIQGRGAPSSFCYQQIQAESLSLERIINLEGNQLALEHQPDILMIVKIEPEEALRKLNIRPDKNDNAIFEKLEFLKKLVPMYEDEEFLPNLFNKSKIVYFDNNIPKEETIKRAREFTEEYLF